MNTIVPSRLLKTAFVLDATGSGAIAALHLLLPAALHDALGLPTAVLTGTGLFLAAYALLLVVLVRCGALLSALVRFVIAGNLGWVVASLLLSITGTLPATTLGVIYVELQAGAVLCFAVLQWRGLARSMPAHGVVARREAVTPGHAG
jgi:hypothetical protein